MLVDAQISFSLASDANDKDNVHTKWNETFLLTNPVQFHRQKPFACIMHERRIMHFLFNSSISVIILSFFNFFLSLGGGGRTLYVCAFMYVHLCIRACISSLVLFIWVVFDFKFVLCIFFQCSFSFLVFVRIHV